MIARTITPKRAKRSTMPNHADNGARAWATSRSESVPAISVHQVQRFNQARIADGKEGSPSHNSQINETERCADGDERNQIPNADVHASAMQSRQNDDVNVEHLHEEHPAGEDRELMRMLLNGLHQQNWKRYKEPANHEEHAHCLLRFCVSRDEKLRLLRYVRIPDEHVLTEADVGPENAEGQHPFPHDVIMLDCDHLFQVTGLTQSRDDQNEERH